MHIHIHIYIEQREREDKSVEQRRKRNLSIAVYERLDGEMEKKHLSQKQTKRSMAINAFHLLTEMQGASRK